MNFISLYVSIFLGIGIVLGLIVLIWIKIEDYWINKHSAHNKR